MTISVFRPYGVRQRIPTEDKSVSLDGLLLTKNDVIPLETSTTLQFSDPDAVGEYFGVGSGEHRFARVYFHGDEEAGRAPKALYISRRLDEDAAPFLRGGPLADPLAALRGARGGCLTLRSGAQEQVLRDLDFSSAHSFAAVARILQSALNAAPGAAFRDALASYDPGFRAIVITSGRTGADAGVFQASGDVADLLALTPKKGAMASKGADAVSESDQMALFHHADCGWRTFTTLWKADADEMLAFGSWASSQGVKMLYVPWDDDPGLLRATNQATSAARLREEGVGATALMWKAPEYSAFLMGVAASIDWGRRDGSTTFAFKNRDGLAPSVDRLGDALSLETQGVNYLGSFSTRNEQFVLSYHGGASGAWRWVDAYVNAIWLRETLEAALEEAPCEEFDFASIDAGVVEPRQGAFRFRNAIEKALANGVVTPGMSLSIRQKAAIEAEAGEPIADALERSGWFAKIVNKAAWNRGAPPLVKVWYTDAGSVHALWIEAASAVNQSSDWSRRFGVGLEKCREQIAYASGL